MIWNMEQEKIKISIPLKTLHRITEIGLTQNASFERSDQVSMHNALFIGSADPNASFSKHFFQAVLVFGKENVQHALCLKIGQRSESWEFSCSFSFYVLCFLSVFYLPTNLGIEPLTRKILEEIIKSLIFILVKMSFLVKLFFSSWLVKIYLSRFFSFFS